MLCPLSYGTSIRLYSQDSWAIIVTGPRPSLDVLTFATVVSIATVPSGLTTWAMLDPGAPMTVVTSPVVRSLRTLPTVSSMWVIPSG